MPQPLPGVELRDPKEADWPAILALANRSVQAVLGAGRQDDWLRNRQRPCPVRRHVVAVEGADVVGYAALEWQPSYAEKSYRLFVVTEPEQLARLGPTLYRRLEEWLAELGAVNAWFVEYADDEPLFAFVGELGFREARRFRLGSGVECVVVGKRLDGGAA
jgi:GNAT superfamily N-acetyltransferase